MLPGPTLTLTLPSLHDNTVLDCRLFHPSSLDPAEHPSSAPWRKHSAIVAHPYAPLGGCYDDPIVDLVAATLLELGFLVVTFNFRGASGSAGHTSWSAKPERDDYMTIVGFTAYYSHSLDPFSSHPASRSADSPAEALRPGLPVLLLAGYSYGAMITTQLPPLADILAHFSCPVTGSAAAEIRLRAQHLAQHQNSALASALAASSQGYSRRSLGLRVGGDEGRRSHDSRRSHDGRPSHDAEDRIRKGVHDLLAKTKLGRRPLSRSPAPSSPRLASSANAEPRLNVVSGLTCFRPAYLLISPLQGLIANLAAMSFSVPSAVGLPAIFSRRQRSGDPATESRTDSAEREDDSKTAAEQKLVQNHTLALFGDHDVFVSAKRLREWVTRLEAQPGSLFRAHEISSAGHFWIEDRVFYVLRDAIATFACERLKAPGS